MRLAVRVVAVVVGLLCGVGGAQAADVPGSKDPAFFKRFTGSEIISYVVRSYDFYTIALGNGTPGTAFTKSEKLEGPVTRIIYRVPEGHTSLEVFRNYEKMLSAAGFTPMFEIMPGSMTWDGYFYGKFYYQNNNPGGDDPNLLDGGKTPGYLAARGKKDGQDYTVAVYITEARGGNWKRSTMKDPIAIKAGEVVVALDLVSAKAVQGNMVEVKSEDMAKAIKETGKVDVYGILFDVDKTAVKPESAATLEQVAKLLKADAALKLEIAGHTDNTGNAQHNMELSRGRAASVVQALVKTYGIPAARLSPKGYGDTKPVAPNDSEDGRAKNRRVELRKL